MFRKCPALALCCALLFAAGLRPALAGTPTNAPDEKARGERIKAAALRLVSDAEAESALPNVGTQAPAPRQANHLSKKTKIAIAVVVAAVVIAAVVVAAKANDAPGDIRIF